MIKILFLADTHLGIDSPLKPRIERRRRGEDFFENYEKALAPALKGEVDCVIHGGDIFFRHKIQPSLVEKAFEPLKHIADNGIPVYVVPGNHERSVIPHRILADHPRIFIFDKPHTYLYETQKGKLAISGFPCIRKNVRMQFKEMIRQTSWSKVNADARIVCTHQAFEGAIVGIQNYTFRHTDYVIKLKEIPTAFLAVFSGHIHRAQVLQHDLS